MEHRYLDLFQRQWHDLLVPVSASLLYMLPDPEQSTSARAFLVAAYAFAAWCWCRAARKAGSDYDSYWWWVGTVGLILLSINKLFNLRLVFGDTIRVIVKAGNVYYRDHVAQQFVFAIVLPLVLGVVTARILMTKSKAFFEGRASALIGWVLLLLYLVLRQTQEWKPSIVVLNMIRYHDWRLGLELAGIAFVVFAALSRSKTHLGS